MNTVLEGAGELVYLIADTELEKVMTNYQFPDLVKDAKKAFESDESNFIQEVSDRLSALSQKVWSLAEEKEIPFHAQNRQEMKKFLGECEKRSMDAPDDKTHLAEEIYNILAHSAISLSLELLSKIIEIKLSKQKSQQE